MGNTSIILSKKIYLNKNFLCRYKHCVDNTIDFIFFTNNRIFFKLKSKNTMLLEKNNIFIYNEANFSNFALSFYKNIVSRLQNLYLLQYSFFIKLNVIGLGYKNFVLQNKLFLLLGDCNYIVLDIPTTLKVFCKKKQIYLLGIDKDVVFNFANKIKLIKNINYYKGKGILEFQNFKFMKLKTGKKQRFM